MEITLEKIELVKDRTGVSYKEAKDALENADGSVVDAIIAIEEGIDEKGGSKVNEAANETVNKIKEAVKKGNVSKITIKKDDETILNLPLNVGIIGTLLAPWGVIAGMIAAFGFKCKIELTKDDGTVIDISQRAEDIGKEVVEKGSVVVDDVVAKSTAAVEEVIDRGTEAYYNIVDAATDKINEIKIRAGYAEDDECCVGVCDCEGECDCECDCVSDCENTCDDDCKCGCDCEDADEKAEEACEKVYESAEDKAEATVEAIREAADRIKEGL